MKTVLHFGNIDWIHLFDPEKKELNELVKKYDFHELIEEDLFELTNQEKIDIYEDHMFIVVNFPKYNEKIRKYFLNEFSVILGKNTIFTFTKFDTNHIKSIINEYSEELKNRESDEDFKISPYYILYKILDTMYDKSLKMLKKSNKDVGDLEEQLFSSSKLERTLLEQLTIKKRNIVSLKHIFEPHKEILEELQKALPKFYKEDLDVYFEDLEYKHDKIMNMISVGFENTDSLAETYNSLMNIKTNSMIGVLTIFAAITGILTLISGIYGMNIILPGQEHPKIFLLLIGIMISV
jgi:magnesium transporter